jgi:hypothetical protein
LKQGDVGLGAAKGNPAKGQEGPDHFGQATTPRGRGVGGI